MSTMSCVVAPQCTQTPCSSQRSTSARTSGTSGCFDAAIPARSAATSSPAASASAAIRSAALGGITPTSASASASARSTSSHDWSRLSVAKIARSSGVP